jgi:hypothetical protein
MACYVDRRDDASAFLGTSEKQTRSAHIDTLLDSPRNFCVALWLQRCQ